MAFLTTMPLWVSGFLVVALTVLSMFGPWLVRRRIELERLSTNNEVAGFKFATVGVLYAVLLAFAVIVVWEKFSSAEDDVATEAGAAATIYRLSGGIAGPPGVAIRSAMTRYLEDVINDDWPSMEHGGSSTETTHALTGVYQAVLTFDPTDDRGTALFGEMLHQLDQVTQARRARIILADGIVPGVLWIVLFGGALVTIGFTFFFGTENLRAQSWMTGMLALLILSGLLIIVVIDRPFSGPVRVDPHALARVLEDFFLPTAGQ
ncbi:MAG: DUF4239 domain-containing protein [Acetobacteraceae bacterium]|nr:DUF4239 domain-containing protein [Acetobacteraceae bacterium]